jgi:hypothetical protein
VVSETSNSSSHSWTPKASLVLCPLCALHGHTRPSGHTMATMSFVALLYLKDQTATFWATVTRGA